MISRIFRPIRDGFKGVGRHASMSIQSASAVTLALIIISLFLMFSMTVQNFTKGIEESVSISVLVDYSKESAEDEDAISLAIKNISGVSTVTYSSKDEEFQYYLESFDDEKTRKAFEPFKDSNPMHDAFYVETTSGSNIEAIAEEISNIEGVYKVNYGGDSAVSLISALRTIRNGGWIIALALSLLAIFQIQNTIKLTIMARADEIAIMRNVGAKNSFVRSPFMVEGLIIGALGSIIPIAITYFGYNKLYEMTGGHLISNMFSLIVPDPFIYQICGALLIIGMMVGLLGSFLSVTKYLRWKR
ncbi:MAG: permease-like cell division protein FtsX [Bulleidia sp.]|nr:permease-like cell division protein FtsX [Erysipelotrichaceae bacterium]MDY2781417.1 permease-like cell division protein FtsX [Bulleidia sp.]